MKRFYFAFVLLLSLVCRDMRAEGVEPYPYSYELTEEDVHVCTMNTPVQLNKEGGIWGAVSAAKKGEKYMVSVDLVELSENGKLADWANRAGRSEEGAVVLEPGQNRLRLSNGETLSFSKCLVMDNRAKNVVEGACIKIIFFLDCLAGSTQTDVAGMNASQVMARLKRLFGTCNINSLQIGSDVFDFGRFPTAATLSVMLNFLEGAADWDL